jgi:hypothetical protein
MSALVESSLNHLFSQAFKRKENAVAYLSSGMQHLIFPLLSLNTLLMSLPQGKPYGLGKCAMIWPFPKLTLVPYSSSFFIEVTAKCLSS